MQSHEETNLQKECVETFSGLRTEMHKVIVGMDDVLDVLFWTLLCQGHGLFIGVPGLAKTLLISTFSKLLGLDFNRVQFTPDMMPSDLLGSEVLEEDRSSGRRTFLFRKGPLFCQMLLADEINRTPPKTQSALLQAMQEGRISVAGQTLTLEPPFVVFATQNPIESEGTFPLPEAQLDRFLFSIPVRYPQRQDEMEIVKRTTSVQDISLSKQIGVEKIIQYQTLVRKVPVEESLIGFAVDIVRKTRPESGHSLVSEAIRFGAGPRASQALILGAKARALLSGRFAVREEDILKVAPYVLQHRLVLRKMRDHSPEKVLADVLGSV